MEHSWNCCSDSQIGQHVDQLQDDVGRHGCLGLGPGDGLLQPFPGRRDQSGIMLIVHGLHELCGALGQLLRLGRWLGLVERVGQVSKEVGRLRPGFRLEVFRRATRRASSSMWLTTKG